MKLVKIVIRFWITLVSVTSFVAGWIMLVHAPKPSQLFQFADDTPPVPTLEPLPPLSEFRSVNENFQSQQFFSVQPSRRSFFRTGGS